MKARKDKLGASHPDTITSMSNLASTLWNQGRFKEAEKLETEALKLSEDKLGPNHPDTLTTISNLTVTYWKQGPVGRGWRIAGATCRAK